MPSILEELRNRVIEAKQRVDDTARKLQQAEQAHNAASNDFAVWRAALDSEMRNHQVGLEAAKVNQPILEGFTPQDIEVPLILPDGDPAANTEAPLVPTSESMNKTEIIRALLRQNPTGLTPPQIWSHVSDQFKHRPYMYSVLKRLKDRDEISFRRNRYVIRQQSEVNESSMVQ